MSPVAVVTTATTQVPWLLIGVLAGLAGWLCLFPLTVLLDGVGVNPFLGPLLYVGWPVFVAFGIGVVVASASRRFGPPAILDAGARWRLLGGALACALVLYLGPPLSFT